MAEVLAAHRQSSYTVTLLDRDDQEIQTLDGVTGGSVTNNVNARLRQSGSLTLTDRGQGVDWASQRVRIDWHVHTRLGDKHWGLGVFLFAAPKLSQHDGWRQWSVELLGKLTVVDEDKVEGTYSVATGTNVTDLVVSLIQSAGEDRIACTPSDAVTTAMMTWDPGTPKLTIINDLLASINYWALWTDGVGQYRVEPYVAPAQRPVTWLFEEGESSIHLPEWDLDQDTAGVPNKIVLVGQGSEDEPALVGLALNENPDSPYSFQARGRWITHTDSGVEAADQSTLTALAQRKLIDLSTPNATISAQHMPIPLLGNERVAWRSQGEVADAIVQQATLDLAAGALMSSELLEVAA